MAGHGLTVLRITALGMALAVTGGFAAQAQPQRFLPPVIVAEPAPGDFRWGIVGKHVHRAGNGFETHRGYGHRYDDHHGIWGRVVEGSWDRRRPGRQVRDGCTRTGWTADGRAIFECVERRPGDIQDRWTLDDNPFPLDRSRQWHTEPRNGHDNDSSASRYMGHPSVISPNH